MGRGEGREVAREAREVEGDHTGGRAENGRWRAGHRHEEEQPVGVEEGAWGKGV